MTKTEGENITLKGGYRYQVNIELVQLGPYPVVVSCNLGSSIVGEPMQGFTDLSGNSSRSFNHVIDLRGSSDKIMKLIKINGVSSVLVGYGDGEYKATEVNIKQIADSDNGHQTSSLT